jgi:peptide/nickel transport system substrate-binding protein
MTDQGRTPRRLRRTWRRLAALTAAGAVVLAGCSIDIKSQPDPSLGDDTMLLAADHGSPAFQRNFNPYLAGSRIAVNYVYEPLAVVDSITGKETPWLATKVDQPDARTIVFTIRQGVKWSDGTALTPDDVVFTLDLLKKYPSLDGKGVWNYAKSVERRGDDVVVHLKSQDVPAVWAIEQTLVVPQHIWQGVAHPDTWTNPDPVGSGPFTLGRYAPTQYTMDKYAGYWQADKVAPKHLVLPASGTELDVVTQGFDWAYSFLTDVKGTWEKANSANSYWFPPAGTISLIPNLTKKPYSDVNFRQGLSKSLDRKAIGDAAAEGYMDPAGQSGLLLPNQQDWLDPSLPDQGLVAQDRKAALASFAKAGYHLHGSRLVGPTGKQATLTIMTANGYSDWLKGVQEVQKELAKVGIRVKISQPQPAAYYSSLAGGDFDVAMGGVGGTGNVYLDFDGNLGGDKYQPIGKQASGNFARYRNDQVDAILDRFRVALDPTEQKKLANQLQQIFFDQVPTISLYYGGSWGLFSTQKFTGWPSAKDPYAGPQNYGSPQASGSSPLLVLTHLHRTGGGDDK